METFDNINLAITIALGILSLGLSAFAIWLSMKFSDRSDQALESVKALTNDIRSMMEVSLTHQRDFSSKMLDSILEQNQYGLPRDKGQMEQSAVVENIIQARLKESESRIANILEEKIIQLTPPANRDSEEVKQALLDIRSELGKYSNTVAKVSTDLALPSRVRNGLISLKEFPAHYVIVAAIVRSSVESLEGLSAVASEYNLPEGFEGGLDNLIREGVVSGSIGNFHIEEEHQAPLSAWVARNWRTIKKLIDHFPTKEEDGVEPFERELAEEIVF